jgi:hypothetical protein
MSSSGNAKLLPREGIKVIRRSCPLGTHQLRLADFFRSRSLWMLSLILTVLTTSPDITHEVKNNSRQPSYSITHSSDLLHLSVAPPNIFSSEIVQVYFLCSQVRFHLMATLYLTCR